MYVLYQDGEDVLLIYMYKYITTHTHRDTHKSGKDVLALVTPRGCPVNRMFSMNGHVSRGRRPVTALMVQRCLLLLLLLSIQNARAKVRINSFESLEGRAG